MMLDFANLFLTAQDGVTGILFFFSDYFAKSCLSPLFFNGGPELDVSVRNCFMCIGAYLLSDVVYHMFFHMEDKDKVVLAISRLIASATQLLLFLRVLLKENATGVFNETTLVALIVANSYNLLWLARDLLQDFRVQDGVKASRTLTKQDDVTLHSKKIGMVVALANCLPWGIVMYLFPHTFGPDGMMPSIARTGNGTEQSRAIWSFVMRLHGAHIISSAPALLCIYWRAYQWSISYVIGLLLYISCSVRGLLDSTGVLDRQTCFVMLVSQVATLIVVGKLTVLSPHKKPSDAAPKTGPDEVPPLQAEHTKKKA